MKDSPTTAAIARILAGAAVMPQIYPDQATRIRTLVAWAGFAARGEDREHAGRHETAPERMVRTEPPEAILHALLSAPLTSRQLDGTAELVTSSGWATPLPEALRVTLIAHVTSTGSEPMKFRMRHGYGADRPE
jgi:hypothetical protein